MSFLFDSLFLQNLSFNKIYKIFDLLYLFLRKEVRLLNVTKCNYKNRMNARQVCLYRFRNIYLLNVKHVYVQDNSKFFT